MDDTRTRPRAATALLLTAMLSLLLSGCIRFDMDMTVASDDTISGTMVFAVDRALLEMSGDAASVDDMLGEGDQPFPDDIAGVAIEPYEDEDWVGQQYVFDAVPLAAFNDQAGDEPGDALRIERDGDVYRVTGAFDMTEGDVEGGGDLGMDPSMFLGGAEMQIRLTFPGEVLESNGEVEDNTVAWDLDLSGRNDLTAVARADAGTAVDDLVLYGLVAVVVLGIGAVIVLLMRRGKDGTTAPARTPEPIGAPLSAREIADREAAAAAARQGEPAPVPPAPAAAPELVPTGTGASSWPSPSTAAAPAAPAAHIAPASARMSPPPPPPPPGGNPPPPPPQG